MSLRKMVPVKPAKDAHKKHKAAPKPAGRKPAGKKPQRQHRRPIGG